MPLGTRRYHDAAGNANGALARQGLSKLEVAEKLGISEPTVQKWTGRYQKLGLAGLDDVKGRGRKLSIDPLVREQIVTGATQPPRGSIFPNQHTGGLLCVLVNIILLISM